jgi:hypothetical protein
MPLSEKEQRFFSPNAEKSGGDRQTPDYRSGQQLKILAKIFCRRAAFTIKS